MIAPYVHRHAHGTWLHSEDEAYPHGGQTRKGLAVWPDGKLRRVWAGIADTFFTIPAHGRWRGLYVAGYLSVDDSFTVEDDGTPLGRRVDSPTYGALLFRVKTDGKYAWLGEKEARGV